ncbi:MAG: glutamine--fructose-6-phosphate transaminase (isomerizing) [Methanobrevibacter sp.]|jgi:glucosamine--fructose-6-phosphate aminotransferase (isomerizing)|nr:glutamine--fructose-6-phosphate transaminase (isomerizing) [Methanobrevibacter sp.]
MCGIVGYVGIGKVGSVLFDSVKKLEYRGYDSVGIATLSEGKIELRKDNGKIDDVDKKIHLGDVKGNLGIAHVRWATHGRPNKINSHPHTNNDDTIAIVHNGIIENYEELKTNLISKGYIFKSETDSEVIAHLLEKFINDGFDFQDSMIEMVKSLDGSYAIGAIYNNNPDEVLAIKNESPLVVGLSEDGNFIASDVPAFLKHTKKVIFPQDKELIILKKDKVIVKDLNGKILDKNIQTIEWNEKMAQKEGYNHFMLKEINQQPNVVVNTLKAKKDIENIVSNLNDINKIYFVACGTSYHAALTGKYLLEVFTNIKTDVIYSSEFKYFTNTLDENTLTIFVSQSGETADTLSAIKMSKVSRTLAIVNILGSSITREADNVIYTKAGPEIGVAATKTYLSQLVSIYLLVTYLSKNKNNKFYHEMISQIEKVPRYINDLLSDEDKIKEIAHKYKDTKEFFFLGRGFIYPTALEGALKLKEITYIHAEGYPSGELKHGPLALIDENVAVVVLAPNENSKSISNLDSYKDTINNMEEVKSRAAKIILLTSHENGKYNNVDDLFTMDNQVDELISPIVYVVPLQLLSYYISIYKGLDPDKPRNLAKCVTVK